MKLKDPTHSYRGHSLMCHRQRSQTEGCQSGQQPAAGGPGMAEFHDGTMRAASGVAMARSVTDRASVITTSGALRDSDVGDVYLYFRMVLYWNESIVFSVYSS